MGILNLKDPVIWAYIVVAVGLACLAVYWFN